MSAAQMPTLPGKVDGVVGWDPCILQCRECGKTATQNGRSAATFIIQSGFHFHTCRRGIEQPRRLCPDCLTVAEAACPNIGKHQ